MAVDVIDELEVPVDEALAPELESLTVMTARETVLHFFNEEVAHSDLAGKTTMSPPEGYTFAPIDDVAEFMRDTGISVTESANGRIRFEAAEGTTLGASLNKVGAKLKSDVGTPEISEVLPKASIAAAGSEVANATWEDVQVDLVTPSDPYPGVDFDDWDVSKLPDEKETDLLKLLTDKVKNNRTTAENTFDLRNFDRVPVKKIQEMLGENADVKPYNENDPTSAVKVVVTPEQRAALLAHLATVTGQAVPEVEAVSASTLTPVVEAPAPVVENLEANFAAPVVDQPSLLSQVAAQHAGRVQENINLKTFEFVGATRADMEALNAELNVLGGVNCVTFTPETANSRSVVSVDLTHAAPSIFGRLEQMAKAAQAPEQNFAVQPEAQATNQEIPAPAAQSTLTPLQAMAQSYFAAKAAGQPVDNLPFENVSKEDYAAVLGFMQKHQASNLISPPVSNLESPPKTITINFKQLVKDAPAALAELKAEAEGMEIVTARKSGAQVFDESRDFIRGAWQEVGEEKNFAVKAMMATSIALSYVPVKLGFLAKAGAADLSNGASDLGKSLNAELNVADGSVTDRVNKAVDKGLNSVAEGARETGRNFRKAGRAIAEIFVKFDDAPAAAAAAEARPTEEVAAPRAAAEPETNFSTQPVAEKQKTAAREDHRDAQGVYAEKGGYEAMQAALNQWSAEKDLSTPSATTNAALPNFKANAAGKSAAL